MYQLTTKESNVIATLRKVENATKLLKNYIYCALFFLSVQDEQNFYLFEQKAESAKKFLEAEKEKYNILIN